MTVFNTYSTGTAGVINGATVINGAGTLWSGINVRPGDDIELDGHTVVILDVLSTTQLQISPWPYASVPVSASPASPYKIIWRSPLRYAGGQAMSDVDALIASLSNPIFSGTVTAPIIAGGSLAASTLVLESTSGAGTTDAIIFKTASQVEAARFDTAGRLTIGGAGVANTAIDSYQSKLQVFQTIAAWNASFVKNKADAEGALIALVKSRHATAGSNTIVQSSDELGRISFYGADGTNFIAGALIKAIVDGTPGTNDMPTRLGFWLTKDGSATAIERLRLDNAGLIVVNPTGLALGGQKAWVEAHSMDGSSGFGVVSWANDTTLGCFDCSKSRGTTVGSHVIVQNGDFIGAYRGFGSDGTQFREAAAVDMKVDGTPSAGASVPGRIQFSTTLLGNTFATARMNIYSTGWVDIQSTSDIIHFSLSKYSADTAGAYFAFQKSRSATVNVGAAVSAGDIAGTIRFHLADNATPPGYNQGAIITGTVEGTPSATTAPTRIHIGTATQGNSFATERFRVGLAGTIYFPSVGTTASAANAFLDSGSSPVNQLLRSTSSLRYKQNIELANQSVMDKILGLKPIWYRSLAVRDNPDHSWYGLAAEEVAEADPRLVSWGFLDEDYERTIAACGTEIVTVRPGAKPVPDAVMYDRVAILQIAALKARIEKLENQNGGR